MTRDQQNAFDTGRKDGAADRAKGRTPEHSHTAYDVRQYSDVGEWKAYNGGYFQAAATVANACESCAAGDHTKCRGVERVQLVGAVVCDCNCPPGPNTVHTDGIFYPKPALGETAAEAQRMLYAGRPATALREAKVFDKERLIDSPLFKKLGRLF